MALFTWTGQSTTTPTGDQVISTGYKMSFFGAAFNDPITITTDYNDSTHVEDAGKVEQCSGGPHMHNTKYESGTEVRLDGAVKQNLNTLGNSDVPLKVNFGHGSSVITESAAFWAYGASEAVGPTNVSIWAAEAGITSTWVNCEGSGAKLTLQDNTTGTSHDFFIALTVQPDTVGEKATEATMKIELTYS